MLTTAVAITTTSSLGDCEAIHDGLLIQPTNSLSSLAFVAIGGWVAYRALAMEPGARWPGLTLGVALVANGVGSAWYHGRPGEAGHWLHDLSVLALLLVVVVFDLTLRTSRGGRTALTAVAAALVVFGLVEIVWPDETNQWVLYLALCLVLAEVQVARDSRRRGEPAWPAGHHAAKRVLVASLVLAATGFVLGQSGSDLCRPGSAWQFHALWHVSVAVAAGAYAVAVLEPRARAAFARGPAVSEPAS